MTRHFEVTARDGPARIGRLRLDEPLETPAIISREAIRSAGPIWAFSSLDQARKAGAMAAEETGRIFIGPSVAVPLHTEPPFAIPWIPSKGPSGTVFHPLAKEAPPASDVYVIGAAGSLRNPRELVAAVVRIRNETPPDSALYAPALATPSNLALLVYLGVDLVDGTRVVVDGLLGRYHLRDGVWDAGDLRELPCPCPHCRVMAEEGGRDPKLVAEHNLLKLEEEILLARETIRSGTIRELIEGRVRVAPEQTAALRLLDREHQYLEQRTPATRRSVMYANCAESLDRVEVTRFAGRVIERYRAPESDVLLLLPCSARKPYSSSRSHRLFAMALGSTRRRLHELILTSPLALVPRELEEVYPAASYDVPVTGRWDLLERDWLARCLDAYLERNRYGTIVAHLEGELRETVEEHGIDAVYTGGGTDDQALKRLKEAVDEATSGAKPLEGYMIQKFLALADYHFGRGAGLALLEGEVRVKGRELLSAQRKPLASLTPNGTIALSIEGAKRLVPLASYIVEIGDFVPRGDVLAPGVTGADDAIRPGDEVIVMGEAVFGVGRARMSGWEMVRSSRGVAVELRHVAKL